MNAYVDDECRENAGVDAGQARVGAHEHGARWPLNRPRVRVDDECRVSARGCGSRVRESDRARGSR